jgi:hypothetical protein
MKLGTKAEAPFRIYLIADILLCAYELEQAQAEGPSP